MKRKDIIMLIYLIGLWIIGFPITIFLIFKITDNTFEKYPSVKNNEQVYEVVEQRTKFKGYTLIKSSNKKAFSVKAFNWGRKPGSLYYYIEIGDSISRKPFSDTLYLFKAEIDSVLVFEIQPYK